MKKTLLLLVPASLTMLLASCGGQQPSSQSTAFSEKSEATSTPTSKSEETSQPSVTSESEETSMSTFISSESEESTVTSSDTQPDPDPLYNGVDHDFRLEAEAGVLDGTRAKRSDNPAASGGLMAADINDCGQGLEWIHYAPVAGIHELNVAYWTGAANSKHGVYLNGVKVGDAVYAEANGWADGVTGPAIVTVSVDLVKGYNKISLVKDGGASDNPEYGGWAQIDYVDIVGANATYDVESLDFTVSEIVLEAERGNFHTGGLPFQCDTMGENYAVGEINEAGHGVDIYFKVPVEGHYGVKITYAQGGSGNVADVTMNGEVGEYELPAYEGQAYNVPNTSEVVVSAQCFNSSLNFVSVTRSPNSAGWFIIDSITLVPLTE